MKRIRRIEITRYRRTVTVIQDAEAPTDPAINLAAIDVVADEWQVLPPGDQDGAERVVKVVLSNDLPILRRWSSFKFREWLRQRL